ncbi:MAG: SpoIID/LytB domain-containing protein [Cyanobacteria bacterium M5B4]|nr:SpoIID/LytB domain-containing protein [Cyanobacteria bacterium KgW148]PLS69279.1 MAG: SpoIID/LytB domain-containing protein [Cyanobacteria bacterium M5B4]
MINCNKVFRSVVLTLVFTTIAGISQSAAAVIIRVLVSEEPGDVVKVAVTQPSRLEVSGQTTSLNPGQWYTIPSNPPARIIPSNNGLIQVKETLYPGEIQITQWRDQSIAVNVLPIEEYLRGVVPSEMPASWHLDALMAQAVAARSYAINTQRQRKWGNAPYDLVSDTRDQVFKGFYRFDPQTGQTKPVIHSRSDQAIAATEGYILSPEFKGYYRARLKRDWVSWGNGYMPISDGQHLDQEMTNQMANRGWNWLQILGWWYRTKPIKSQ